MTARVIIISVPKGGSGKTTTAQCIGLALKESGKRVLFVDTDPQGNLSSILGYRHKKNAPTLYTVLREFTFNRKKTLPSAIYHLPTGVDVVPANMLLNNAADELAAQVEREHILEKLLNPVLEQYDVILIDTPPSINVLVNNALVAATEIIIPVHAEPLGIAGAAMMLSHLQKVRDDGMIKELIIRGGLITMLDRRTALNTQSSEYARTTLGPHLPFFDVEIERTVRVPEAQLYRESILTYMPRETKKVSLAYRSVRDALLSEEIGKHISTLNIHDGFVEEVLEMTDDIKKEQLDAETTL